MAVSNLGECEHFVRRIRRSNVVDPALLDTAIEKYLKQHLRPATAGLAEHLVQQNVLTPFQADRLLKEDPQDLVLGPYTLVDELGFGSMGTVYRAMNKEGATFALKLLPRRSTWNVLLARRHVQTFKQAQHPSVVPFLDVGSTVNQHYLVWPFVEGEPLDKVVERESRLDPGLAAHYGKQLAEGLFITHRLALFHGLLKPSNLMVHGKEIRILDFGIGAILTQNSDAQSMIHTQGQANLATSALTCASPESIQDETCLNPKGDQYSLGCILYYAITGHFPFEGSAMDAMVGHQSQTPAPMREHAPEVPPELEDVVARMMQKKPEDRFEDLEETAEALAPFARVTSRSGTLRAVKPPTPVPTRQELLREAAPEEEPISEPTAEPIPAPAAAAPQRASKPPRRQSEFIHMLVIAVIMGIVLAYAVMGVLYR